MRPSRDQYFLNMAALAATRGTCLRRQVGCVLVNSRGHVIATGRNGVASGMPHCNEMETNPNVMFGGQPSYPHSCAGACAPSGTDLDACEAIHAEQNALLQCRNVFEIDTCYVTVSPCVTCTKLLMNTSCLRIVAAREYSAAGADLWKRAGGYWDILPIERIELNVDQ